MEEENEKKNEEKEKKTEEGEANSLSKEHRFRLVLAVDGSEMWEEGDGACVSDKSKRNNILGVKNVGAERCWLKEYAERREASHTGLARKMWLSALDEKG